jgi:hypothetical protein
MKISVSDIAVAIATINESSAIVDNGTVFSYTLDSRRKVVNRLQTLLESINVDVEISKDKS